MSYTLPPQRLYSKSDIRMIVIRTLIMTLAACAVLANIVMIAVINHNNAVMDEISNPTVISETYTEVNGEVILLISQITKRDVCEYLQTTIWNTPGSENEPLPVTEGRFIMTVCLPIDIAERRTERMNNISLRTQ